MTRHTDEAAIGRFEEYWRRWPDGGPYVHPDDARLLTPRDKELMELSLLPLPVNGDLRRASVVILMLNPSLGSADLTWGTSEQREAMNRSLRSNIFQTGWTDEYPMFDLNPLFSTSGGGKYWARSGAERVRGKFGHIAQALVANRGCTYMAARKHLASEVAVVQLVPYRSTAFRDLQQGQGKAGPPQSRLSSSREALHLARGLIGEGRKLVVVPYGVERWGFSGPYVSESLVVYRPRLREAHFAPTSPGFNPMVSRLTRTAENESNPFQP